LLKVVLNTIKQTNNGQCENLQNWKAPYRYHS
jgi:hypothetical protein